MSKIGRNDPCPCGSGKKYKNCCLVRDKTPPGENEEEPLQSLFEEIRESLKGREFSSLEEAQGFLNELMERKNLEGKPEFWGFSPEEMHRLLHFPFDRTADLVAFNHDLPPEVFQSVPMVADILVFLNELFRVDPLKATAKGNLPLKFCQLLLEKLPPSERSYDFPIRSERDSMRLHSLRHILRMCGWIKKEHNSFCLTQKGKKIFARGFQGEDFFHLLKVYTTRFNWAFQDRYPPFWIIQGGFLFSLYLLTQKALEYIEDTQLANYFIEAFPLILGEAEVITYLKPEETVARCYSLRFLEKFCKMFGFVEIKKEEKDLYRYRLFIKASAFLKNYIQWKAPARFPFSPISKAVH